MRQKLELAIIGPGRLGQALGRLLANSAGIQIGFVAAREIAKARRAVRFIGSGRPVRIGDPRLAESDVVLITASDSAIPPLAEQIASLRDDWSGRIVLHTCGSLPSSALDTFRQRGASIGSLHPYQTAPSPSSGVRHLIGCYWSIEGDRQARALAEKWVRRLRGASFEIRPQAKALYHLSAFMVCPTVVALMDKAGGLLKQAGVPQPLIRPMLGSIVSATACNFVELGGRRALTGPAVRGDRATLDRHLAELRRVSPETVPAYRELLKLMLDVA